MTQTKSSKTGDSSGEVLRVARERFKLAEEAELEIRKVGLEDLKFRSGKQWLDAVKRDRDLEDRPSLTINRMPQVVRQITNDQRQNRPSIKTYPVDEKADVETAKVFQGLIKHIEYNSNGEVAYDTAFSGAVEKGFGYFRVITDYCNPLSFDQEILIKRIRNAFSVYLDPHAQEPDGSDAKWGFIFSDIPKDDYIAEFGETDLAKSADWGSLSAMTPGWISESTVRIAEYFTTEFEMKTIYLLSSGESIEESQLPDMLPNGVAIKTSRKSNVPVIKWYKINGMEILEKTDWLGRWIPIIPVRGDEIDINGEVTYEGVIRHSKDSQRMYNYMASCEAETIALAPKAPFIVAEGQIPPEYAQMWKTANKKSHAYLTYKPTSIQGQAVGAPQRNVYEAPVQAITNARMQASEDIKATTGIYDAALGARSNESSGVAIQRRNNQSQTSNFHFIDNLTRSMRHLGRILVDLIPKVYDAPRAIRIIGEEGEQQIIRINEMFNHNGKNVTYNLGVGTYDVIVETGPSFATKRQEAAASMMDFTKAMPQAAVNVLDLVAKNMDWPGASEFAERFKKMLPPGMAEDDKKQQPIPPQAKAQMDQMSQMIEQLTQHLKEKTHQIETKMIEVESKERIEMEKLKVALQLELIKQQAPAAHAVFEQEMALINQRLNLLDMGEPIDQDMDQQAPLPGQPMQPGQPQQPNQNLPESGPEGAANQQMQQQPTGGMTPG